MTRFGRARRLEAPRVGGERFELGPQLEQALRVADRRFDLAAMADDRRRRAGGSTSRAPKRTIWSASKLRKAARKASRLLRIVSQLRPDWKPRGRASRTGGGRRDREAPLAVVVVAVGRRWPGTRRSAAGRRRRRRVRSQALMAAAEAEAPERGTRRLFFAHRCPPCRLQSRKPLALPASRPAVTFWPGPFREFGRTGPSCPSSPSSIARGSGKSTLATQLAAHFANAGVPVMLGDVDRQQSTQSWLRSRSLQRPAAQRADRRLGGRPEARAAAAGRRPARHARHARRPARLRPGPRRRLRRRHPDAGLQLGLRSRVGRRLLSPS